MKTTPYAAPVLAMLVASGAVLADAGHAHESASRRGDKRWTAPPEAARRGNPVPADSFSRERGRRLFEANCAGCHGPSGGGDGPAATRLEVLPADLRAMAQQYTDGDFAWKISTGRGAMPAWQGILAESQIWDLVNFVQSLGGEPPHSHRY